MQADIAEEIATFIQEESLNKDSANSIDLDENLFTSGILDSMGAMRLVSHLQLKYEYKIPPPDLIPENFKTIHILSRYLAKQLEQR